MKFIKEGIIGNVGVEIMHVGKPINAIDCKDAQLRVTRNDYQNYLLFYIQTVSFWEPNFFHMYLLYRPHFSLLFLTPFTAL